MKKNIVPAFALAMILAVAGIQAKQFKSTPAAAQNAALEISTTGLQGVPPPCFPVNCPSKDEKKDSKDLKK